MWCKCNAIQMQCNADANAMWCKCKVMQMQCDANAMKNTAETIALIRLIRMNQHTTVHQRTRQCTTVHTKYHKIWAYPTSCWHFLGGFLFLFVRSIKRALVKRNLLRGFFYCFHTCKSGIFEAPYLSNGWMDLQKTCTILKFRPKATKNVVVTYTSRASFMTHLRHEVWKSFSFLVAYY